MNPKLFIGPMSKEIVDAVIDYPAPLGLIPSRRQVDHESGYVNGWVTETFCEYVRSRTDNVLLVRDHCGPNQGYHIDNGIESFLIELGGEIRTKGFKSKNETWKVAIEDPTNKNLPLIILEASNYNNFSLATSGEYRNQRKINDILLSHTIDPDTLRPIKKDHLSVSVISNNATEADALATALIVMGEIKGLEFANRNKLKVIYINKEDESVSYKTSKFF